MLSKRNITIIFFLHSQYIYHEFIPEQMAVFFSNYSALACYIAE